MKSMNEHDEARKCYLDAYEAFEEGDLETAAGLARSCLGMASPASYWYAGALGLLCWLANFKSDAVELDRLAKRLLALDTGADKPWFDGMALLNLGLGKRREGDESEARELLSRAAECYARQTLSEGQPGEWQKVIEYFRTLCRWGAATDDIERKSMLSQIKIGSAGKSGLLLQLQKAIRLMIRYTEGEDVNQEAQDSIDAGVSRTFLAFILLA